MPRLPVILATEGVAAPQGPQFPRNYNVGAGVAAGIAAAGQVASEGLFRYAGAQARQADKEAHQEAGLLAADAEQRIGIADTQLRATQRDPDGYVSDYDTLLQQTVGDVAKGAKNAQAAALMQQHLAPVLAKNRVAAAQHAQGLRTDLSVATLDATLDNRKTLAELATTDTDFQRHYVEGANAIKLATPDIGANKAGDALRKFKQDILGARALKEANTDPEAFVQDADSRFGAAGLDAKHLEELKQTARVKADSNRKNLVAEWDKFYTRVETEAEDERKAQVVGLEQAGLKRQLTVSRLDDAKAMRIVTTREEYATLYKLATEQKDAPSNQAVLQDASIRSHRAVPAITPEQLDALYRRPAGEGLNRNDWKELKDKVIGRIDRNKSEGDSESTKRHDQGEQILARALGVSSLYDKIDKQDEQLADIALRELTARSKAFDGKEDPIDVANELANKIAPIRQTRLSLKVADLGRTLRFPAQDAAGAMQRLNEQRATLPPSVVAQEERKIADMTRAEGALADSTAKKKPGEQAGVAKPLRRPDQKPQTGTPD